LLRFWRKTLRFSQQQLAENLQTTPRHLSFLETGRSKPTREMVLRLARAFAFGEGRTGVLLAAAGLSQPGAKVDLSLPEHRQLSENLDLLLNQQNPFPGVVVDRVGHIVRANQSWNRLLELGKASQLGQMDQTNLLDSYFSNAGLREHILDWEQLACSLLLHIKEQQVLTGDPEMGELIAWLESYSGVPKDWAIKAAAMEANSQSMYELTLTFAEQEIALRSVVTGIEPFQAASQPSLLLHAFFPQNQEAQMMFERLAAKANA